MFLSIAGTVLIIACTIHVVYFLCFFRLSVPDTGSSTADEAQPLPFVSVIICARNEEKNLRRHLPSVLQQRYYNAAGKTQYEVVVVNDGSTDASAAFLQELSASSPHLKTVTILPGEQRLLKGKKLALQKGIANATADILLFTDADCQPASEDWISLMTAPFRHGKKIVAGFGGYEIEKTALNAFIRWETLHTYMQYAGYARAGVPYMAVGRNLACTKEIALAAQQSPHWNDLPSGDDDLLISAMATAGNITVVATAAASTLSEPKHSWGEWIKQKQRHVSTGKYYKPGIIALLSAYAYTHAAIWICTIRMCFSGFETLPLAFLIIRCLLYWGVWDRIGKGLKQPVSPSSYSLMDISWFLYNFLLSPYILLRNRQLWK